MEEAEGFSDSGVRHSPPLPMRLHLAIGDEPLHDGPDRVGVSAQRLGDLLAPLAGVAADVVQERGFVHASTTARTTAAQLGPTCDDNAAEGQARTQRIGLPSA